MTMGESIKHIRTQRGLSQDELGRQLYVSRQTISQWETDQTVPTTENLLRLKELFGVSVDEILGFEPEGGTDEVQPVETYRFIYTHEEIEGVRRTFFLKDYNKPYYVVGLLISLFACAVDSAIDVMIYTSIGWILLFLCIFLLRRMRFKKQTSKLFRRLAMSTYDYRLYDDQFEIDVLRGTELVFKSKHRYEDIEEVIQTGKCLQIQCDGMMFPIRKSQLKETSNLYAHLYLHPSKTNRAIISGKENVISYVLFTACFWSIIVNVAMWGLLSMMHLNTFECRWIYAMVIPIPLTSLIYGIVMWTRGFKFKKNIIAGAIVTVALCLMPLLLF